jgi:hypothetical protein
MSDDSSKNIQTDVDKLLKEIEDDRKAFSKKADADFKKLNKKVIDEEHAWQNTRKDLLTTIDKGIVEVDKLAKTSFKK